jgi:hypothetical protein
MFKLSPRLFLSPRFFALPLIALAIIVALAHANSTRISGTQVAAPIIRATTCATPGKAADPACAVARDATVTAVR